jgi:lipopolysaccharide/colanic/teichoic acid biosynthesis glycosyltransferase
MNKNLGLILNSEDFTDLLRQESNRADRTKRVFSVIIFHPVTENNDYTDLIKILKKRIRIYDSIGWFNNEDIGIILPEMSEEYVNKFNVEIQGYTQKIFTYPFHGFLHSDNSICEDLIKNNLPYKMPVWKRSLDIIISFISIAIIFPLIFPIVALFIKIVSPHGPILFRQKRVGVGGKPFTLLKFRTMHPGDIDTTHDSYIKLLMASNASMVKLEDYSRIIPFGKILRASGIDELPQLFNVLCGDMSMVGPRPCIPYEQEKYLRWYHQRLDVPPGLTGLWQVSGKNKLTFQQMMRFDIAYAKDMSLWVDIKIIFKTPLVIFQQIMDTTKKKIIGVRSNDQVETFIT